MQHRLKIRLILPLLGLAAWTQTAHAAAKDPKPDLPSAKARAIIEVRSRNAVAALRGRNMSRLSTYVHPTRGLRFSPYIAAYQDDQKFSRRQVRSLGRTQRKYTWGDYDGTGDPIRLTWRSYFEGFVYNRDYSKAPRVICNVITPRGNTINRLVKTYPKAIFVEYHFPASSKELDWTSLWMVWQKRGTTWYLSGIAHDAWTI